MPPFPSEEDEGGDPIPGIAHTAQQWNPFHLLPLAALGLVACEGDACQADALPVREILSIVKRGVLSSPLCGPFCVWIQHLPWWPQASQSGPQHTARSGPGSETASCAYEPHKCHFPRIDSVGGGVVARTSRWVQITDSTHIHFSHRHVHAHTQKENTEGRSKWEKIPAHIIEEELDAVRELVQEALQQEGWSPIAP